MHLRFHNFYGTEGDKTPGSEFKILNHTYEKLKTGFKFFALFVESYMYSLVTLSI